LRRALARDQKIPRKLLRAIDTLWPGSGFRAGQCRIGGGNHERRKQNNRATKSHGAPHIPPVNIVKPADCQPFLPKTANS
jgi:hypothetical protein